MKTLLLSLALLITGLTNFAQDGHTITVTIDNVKNDTGHVIVSLHTTDTFMKGDGIQAEKSEIKDGKITVTFKGVQPGTYAALAMHDANDNTQMDFDINGMPLESYGMSNNSMNYGPPQFKDAKFEVSDQDLELKIRF